MGNLHHMQAGNNAGNGSALKHPGARGSGIIGDASTAGEAISSAIVKYNYQAQQLDELSLVKGARILILEKSGDGKHKSQVNQTCNDSLHYKLMRINC